MVPFNPPSPSSKRLCCPCSLLWPAVGISGSPGRAFWRIKSRMYFPESEGLYGHRPPPAHDPVFSDGVGLCPLGISFQCLFWWEEDTFTCWHWEFLSAQRSSLLWYYSTVFCFWRTFLLYRYTVFISYQSPWYPCFWKICLGLLTRLCRLITLCVSWSQGIGCLVSKGYGQVCALTAKSIASQISVLPWLKRETQACFLSSLTKSKQAADTYFQNSWNVM